MAYNCNPLNLYIIIDQFPMPNLDVCMEKGKNAKFFGAHNLKLGFYKVVIADNSKHFTGFVLQNSCYQFK